MNEARLIKKKIKNDNYELEDIEKGLTFDNEYFLSFLLYEIAKKKIISSTIIKELKKLAYGNNEKSNKSIGGIFTIKVTACATLMKLGYEDEYKLLSDDEKKVVDRIFDYQDWRDI